jgi:dihydrofolate synthase / folylpolyglutamate synthase
MPKPVHEIYDYIFSLTIPGVKLELDRVYEFSNRIGKPHEHYPIIHVAGTNGKGSTTTMLYAVLLAYGKKTGINISPHLVHPEERIRVNGIPASSEFITQTVAEWKHDIEDLELTFFEVITALAQQYFMEQNVDYAVIETGLGGRLDATNIVDPIVSVITSISLDHTGILGETLEAVAGEKAGIIKANKPVVIGHNPPEAMDVLLQKAKDVNAPVICVADEVEIRDVQIMHDIFQQLVSYKIRGETYKIVIPLLGDFQTENFAIVLLTLLALDIPLDEAIINKGLSQMSWRGRIEILQKSPLFIYDVAHNPSGLERLLNSLIHFGLGDISLLAGLNKRKDLESMFHLLQGWQGHVDFFRYDGHFSCDEDDLRKMLNGKNQLFSSLSEAIKNKNEHGQNACIFGSHYFAKELYSIFDK